MQMPASICWTSRLLAKLCAAAALTLAGARFAAAQDPRELLIRALAASESATYIGEQVTTLTQKSGRTRRTRQRVIRQGNRLRIEYLEPAAVRGRLVVDDGTTTRIYFPRHRLVLRSGTQVGRDARPLREQQIQRLHRGRIDVRLESPETVAGRPTYVVLVKPPGPRERWRRIWVDRDTFVALRIRERHADGRLTTTEFTSIRFQPPPDGAFRLDVPPGTEEVPAGFGLPIPLGRARAIAQRWGGLFQPTYLPPRFRHRLAFRMEHQGEPVVVLLYRGPSGTLSFFQTRGTVPALPGGRMEMAGINVVQAVREDVNLTVLGSLPGEELRKVLDSAQR